MYLPRALSPAWADDHEIAFLLDLRGAGTRALAECQRVSMLGPLGRGFEPSPGRRSWSGAVSARRCCRGSTAGSGADRPVTTVLGFRSDAHAVCAALVDPDATVVLEPTFVTEPLAEVLDPTRDRVRVRAGPDAARRGALVRRARRRPAGSRWRPRWPADSAPATAVPFASTANSSGCASRARCWRPNVSLPDARRPPSRPSSAGSSSPIP